MESPGALSSGGLIFQLVCASIDTGHIAQSPQSGPRWSPAVKIEPVLFPPSVERSEANTADILHPTAPHSLLQFLVCSAFPCAPSMEPHAPIIWMHKLRHVMVISPVLSATA